MYARIEHRDIPEKWDAVEFIDFDPDGLFVPELIWKPVPEWLQPYIDHSYWWDDAAQAFADMTGYTAALDKAKARMQAAFQAAFAALDARSVRPLRTVLKGEEDAQAMAVEEDTLWTLDEVAAWNRAEQARLLALSLAANPTPEEARAVVEEVAGAKPWLLWE